MKKLEKDIQDYLEERGWDNLRPADIAKSVSIEAAELLEVFQWSNPTLEEVKRDEVLLAKMKSELADVMIYCFNMTTLLGLDTEEVIRTKLEKIKQKYPAHLFKNNGTVEPGTEEIYLKIKQEYRRKEE